MQLAETIGFSSEKAVTMPTTVGMHYWAHKRRRSRSMIKKPEINTNCLPSRTHNIPFTSLSMEICVPNMTIIWNDCWKTHDNGQRVKKIDSTVSDGEIDPRWNITPHFHSSPSVAERSVGNDERKFNFEEASTGQWANWKTLLDRPVTLSRLNCSNSTQLRSGAGCISVPAIGVPAKRVRRWRDGAS